MPTSEPLNLNRRALIVAAGACATLPVMSAGATRAQPTPVGQPVNARVSFSVNGEARTLELDTRTTLLDALCKAAQCTWRFEPETKRLVISAK